MAGPYPPLRRSASLHGEQGCGLPAIHSPAMNNRLFAFALGLLAVSGTALAIEGKWTPGQILELGPAWLREQGLQVAPETLWSRDGGGLLEAAVRIGGCSAGFISQRG